MVFFFFSRCNIFNYGKLNGATTKTATSTGGGRAGRNNQDATSTGGGRGATTKTATSTRGGRGGNKKKKKTKNNKKQKKKLLFTHKSTHFDGSHRLFREWSVKTITYFFRSEHPRRQQFQHIHSGEGHHYHHNRRQLISVKPSAHLFCFWEKAKKGKKKKRIVVIK